MSPYQEGDLPVNMGEHSVVFLPEEGCFGVVKCVNAYYCTVAFYKDGRYQEIYIDSEDMEGQFEV